MPRAQHNVPPLPPPSLDAIDVSDVALSGQTPPLSDSDGEEAHAPLGVEEAAVLARHAPPVSRLLARREHVQVVRHALVVHIE